MSLVTDSLFGTENKVEKSIEALKLFEPPEGYYVAFSGGKDSVVVKALCDMAGVKYDAHYCVTSVDPPELVRFIKDKFPDVSRDIPKDDDGKPITMWTLIPRKMIPPTRLYRYCCEELKESRSKGRLTVTGVRWAESNNRSSNQGLILVRDAKKAIRDNPSFRQTPRGGAVLVNDNTESREIIEGCYQKNKVVLNPIIDWEDEDVWEFIKQNNLPYCELYDMGYKRLGCIGCPISYAAEAELERYPKYKQAYLRAFARVIENRKKNGLEVKDNWDTADKMLEWWLSDKRRADKPIDGQIGFFQEE